MKDKVKELSAEVVAIADTISVIEEQLQEEDVTLLKVCCKYLVQVSPTFFPPGANVSC